mmetsp:Transcript_13928/g.40754  ORF Transcript_13928/g.40754 Transcript_13928/m.40754 type:complete len:113 (-) Transcript_13928:55-393(-)
MEAPPDLVSDSDVSSGVAERVEARTRAGRRWEEMWQRDRSAKGALQLWLSRFSVGRKADAAVEDDKVNATTAAADRMSLIVQATQRAEYLSSLLVSTVPLCGTLTGYCMTLV